MTTYVIFAVAFLAMVAANRDGLHRRPGGRADSDREPMSWRNPRDVAIVGFAIVGLAVGALGIAAIKAST